MDYVRDYYMIGDNWDKWVGVTDVGDYCSTRRKAKYDKPFGDPPRKFESFRKDTCPGHWEVKKDGMKTLVKFRGVCMSTLGLTFLIRSVQYLINDILKMYLDRIIDE